MPEKITLADGSEREVPTAEEIAALTQAAEEKKALETKLSSFENDPVQKNWSAMRQVNESLKANSENRTRPLKRTRHASFRRRLGT